MKNKKPSIIAGVALILTVVLTACTYESYSVENFCGTTIDDNPNHVLITMDKFKGKMLDKRDFSYAKRIHVELEANGKPFDFQIIAPNKEIIYKVIVKDKKIGKDIEGDFPKGEYKLMLKSKKLDHAEIKVMFD